MDYFRDSIINLQESITYPGDSKELVARKILLIIISYLIAAISFLFSLYYFFITVYYQAGLVMLCSTLLIIFNLAMFLYNKNHRVHAHIFIGICLFTPFLVHLFLSSTNNSPIIWAAMVPILSVTISTYKWGVFWMIDYLILLILTSYADQIIFNGPEIKYITINEVFSQINFLIFPLVCLFVLNLYVRKVERLDTRNNQLTNDKLMNDQLISNLLPEEIAMRMKYESNVITDDYENVTVLFADIVGFTQLSSRLAPKELVDLLNVIFSALDRIVEAHGMEKIKTMGDAYMAAAGIPSPLENHAEIAAQVALRFMEEVQKFAQMSGSDLKVRIGLHSGPVVAGVIGLKKTIYDLWGDTVNVAARMEHHGIPDRIQVTKATYTLLKNKFSFIARGEIQVKGKGAMETFILLDKKKDYKVEESTIPISMVSMTM